MAAAPPISSNDVATFHEDLHANYILSLKEQKESFESCIIEHLRMSGIYWGLTAMALMGRDDEMEKEKIVEWVMRCEHECGGFSGNIGHDPHLLYTCHAVLILAVCDSLDRLDKDRLAGYVESHQQPNGSFAGDVWLEIDVKYTYCSLLILTIIGKLERVNQEKAAEYVAQCMNFDGGFGNLPGCESHGGHIFTAVGALSLARELEIAESDTLGWWLCERQCDSGGLNGRPEKQADVCYSWWNISSLIMIGKLSWINKQKLIQFILDCQDVEDGGIADRPGNVADVYHTFFGIGGLSLLGYFDEHAATNPQFLKYRKIHPTFAIPIDIVEKLGLNSQIQG